jgi:hypothetical protein
MLLLSQAISHQRAAVSDQLKNLTARWMPNAYG